MARVARRHPDWPPTLPQFLACAKPEPEDFGAPGLDCAWQEARKHGMSPESHKWSHDAVRMAGRKIGWADIHRATSSWAKSLKAKFSREYVKCCEQVAQGQGLLESDAIKNPAQRAIIAGDEAARQASSEYEGITGPQALKLMRAMAGGRENNDEA